MGSLQHLETRLDIDRIIQTVKDCLPESTDPIPLHEPCFAGNEWEYVRECLNSGWVSSAGRYVDRFEQGLSEFTGANYSVATVNGTAALHICLLLSGVKPGDEVLTPALSFIATSNAINYCGATPHFVDSDESNLGVSAEKLADYLNDISSVRSGECRNRFTGNRIRSLVAMHTFGHPVDLNALIEITDRYNIALVEDAAEAMGSYYLGEHVGHRGLLGALSFNGNKIVTTGGGGAILTDSSELAQLARHMTTTAKMPHRWRFDHDMIGYNYRLPNINAALGCAQLEELPHFLSAKRKLAKKYQSYLAGIEGVSVLKETDYAKSNYWLNVLLLGPTFSESRDALLDACNAAGLLTRPAWTLHHHLPMYQSCPRMDLGSAEDIESRLINLPSSAALADAE